MSLPGLLRGGKLQLCWGTAHAQEHRRGRFRGSFPGRVLQIPFFLVRSLSFYLFQTCPSLKAVPSCNTSSSVSLKGWRTLREGRKEL